VKFIVLFCNHFIEMEYWSKIFDEMDQLSEMEESNMMRHVKNKDELVGGDCILSFTTDEVS